MVRRMCFLRISLPLRNIESAVGGFDVEEVFTIGSEGVFPALPEGFERRGNKIKTIAYRAHPNIVTLWDTGTSCSEPGQNHQLSSYDNWDTILKDLGQYL